MWLTCRINSASVDERGERMRVCEISADCYCTGVYVECLQLHSRYLCADISKFLEFCQFFTCNVSYFEHTLKFPHAHIVNTKIRWLKMTSCCFGLVVRAVEVAVRYGTLSHSQCSDVAQQNEILQSAFSKRIHNNVNLCLLNRKIF